MNTYGARPEVIAIPVDEYKELLAANTELKIIYHKLESCTITTEKYTFHEFVQNMHDALHSVELDAEAPAPVIPGMVEPLAAMHAQGAERLTEAIRSMLRKSIRMGIPCRWALSSGMGLTARSIRSSRS